MRQLKFRAWFSHKNKMVHSENLFLHYDGEDSFDFAFDKEVVDEEGNVEGTMNFNVLQYTGLKDKNGVEIYEGDICSTDLSRPYNIVVSRNGAFMYQCNDHDKNYFDILVPVDEATDQDRYTEVIGNIYEHQHLLEVAE